MDSIEANYIKEFSAMVIKQQDDYICLDQSAFYPVGGGQPSDRGIIQWQGHHSEVKEVIKKGDTIKHVLNGEMPDKGMKINAVIDWDIRYSHMKMHTAQHIISGIVFDEYNARTVGNQIHAQKTRIDFYPIRFSSEDLKIIENTFNDIIAKKLPLTIYEEKRSTIEKQVNQQRCNLDLLPDSIQQLRIVEIKGYDICPCAGTHVKNTSELSPIEILKKETKGNQKERITYAFKS